MTKQEEIREEIAERICDALEGDEWFSLAEGQKRFCRLYATNILSYLHSQGVVIKVERELPDLPISQDDYDIVFYPEKVYREAQNIMLKADYAAVEPLIKE